MKHDFKAALDAFDDYIGIRMDEGHIATIRAALELAIKSSAIASEAQDNKLLVPRICVLYHEMAQIFSDKQYNPIGVKCLTCDVEYKSPQPAPKENCDCKTDLAHGPSACPYCAAALHIQTDGSYLVSMCKNPACSSNKKDKP